MPSVDACRNTTPIKMAIASPALILSAAHAEYLGRDAQPVLILLVEIQQGSVLASQDTILTMGNAPSAQPVVGLVYPKLVASNA